MGNTRLAKRAEGYSYRYVELADINKYCEDNDIRYYQEIETNEINQKDYIITYLVIGDNKPEKHRGCQIVEAKLSGINNPVQAYGSSLTYCRRYSLLMALGLATEDDDGASLSEPTKEDAEKYTFENGKHKGWTLKRVVEEDKGFLNWLLANSKDERLLKMIELLTGEVPKSDEEWDNEIELTQQLQRLIVDKNLNEEKICEHYKVEKLSDLSKEQIKEFLERGSK